MIDALGMHLIEEGLRVAVLAVDPSSRVSGGSILGDNTRMGRLARSEDAFIRPSPTAQATGGGAARTHEDLLLSEAAGYDVVVVETVGAGQAETEVADMVDTYVALMLPGGGDELQGIKKGIVELADIVVINKADGDLLAAARASATELGSALRIARPEAEDGWLPCVQLASARTGTGVAELWALIHAHEAASQTAGAWDALRAEQRVRRMWRLAEEAVIAALHDDPAVLSRGAELEAEVRAGNTTPAAAARDLVTALDARR